ncbi:hypothetical protein TWF281_002360 [Arthrobotrys megalospora]
MLTETLQKFRDEFTAIMARKPAIDEDMLKALEGLAELHSNAIMSEDGPFKVIPREHSHKVEPVHNKLRDAHRAEARWKADHAAIQTGVVELAIGKVKKWRQECNVTHDIFNLAARVRKLRDAIEDVDNEFWAAGCRMWAKIAQRHPSLDDMVEGVLGENLTPNRPEFLKAQLKAYKDIDG